MLLETQLGMAEEKQDLLLVGQSNAAMTDPAHYTVIVMSGTMERPYE